MNENSWSNDTGRRWIAAATLLAGLAVAWIDSRPNWDDTGVSAVMVLVTAGAGSALGVPAWLAALLAAGPLVAAGLAAGNTGTLLALVIAIVGAIAGSVVRRLVGGGPAGREP